MKRPLWPTPIVSVFLLSLIYWIYLSLTTQMDIVLDSVSYESLGRLIYTHGWESYFITGPNREPLYPLLISLGMSIEHFTGLTYVKVMALFGIIFLSLTQALTYKILRLLNVRRNICILILSYLALSPALNNAAFSLYSEIAIFPLILSIILTSFYTWEAIAQNAWKKSFIYSTLLGAFLAASTFIKAIFECISPAYLIIFFAIAFLLYQQKITKAILPFSLCVISAFCFFYIPVATYKCLNQHYNGHFAITNRASWALYGNTARRMEPLTSKRLATALAYAPGEGFCKSLWGTVACDFWSFRKSDELGFNQLSELGKQHLSPEKMDTTLLMSSAQKALHNPAQYILLTSVEGLKMFFWESTQIGFVSYPRWLQKIYNIKLFNNALRFTAFLASFLAVLSIWHQALVPQKSPLAFLIGLLIFLYILFFSFFFILTRYALPIAPLFLISIGLWIDENCNYKCEKKE